MAPHDVYLLDRLARAVQRGLSMTEAQREDLAAFVCVSAGSDAVKLLGERLRSGRLRLEEILAVAENLPYVDLVRFRRELYVPAPQDESVTGLAATMPSKVSWWRKLVLWALRHVG